MQSIEEKKIHDNVIKKTCYTTDIVYMLLHIVYLLLFLISKKYEMAYVSLAGVLIYVLFIFLLKKDKYYAYAIGCGGEFILYMSIATIFCGFEAGFHLCIIGLSVVSFFTVYFSKKDGRISRAIYWCIYSLIVYLGLYIYLSFNNSIYQIEKWLRMTFFIIHTFAVFSFVASYLVIFLNYAMKLEKKIMNESRLDKLTQIYNRYALYNYLESINDKTDYFLVILDIDDFKKINDVYGHICGDHILKEVASISYSHLSNSNYIVSRYGGEEFVFICKNNDKEAIFKEIDDLRIRIEKYIFNFNDIEIKLTVTIGIEKYTEGISNEKWISLADEKLYLGKNSGKNKTVM